MSDDLPGWAKVTTFILFAAVFVASTALGIYIFVNPGGDERNIVGGIAYFVIGEPIILGLTGLIVSAVLAPFIALSERS